MKKFNLLASIALASIIAACGEEPMAPAPTVNIHLPDVTFPQGEPSGEDPELTLEERLDQKCPDGDYDINVVTTDDLRTYNRGWEARLITLEITACNTVDVSPIFLEIPHMTEVFRKVEHDGSYEKLFEMIGGIISVPLAQDVTNVPERRTLRLTLYGRIPITAEEDGIYSVRLMRDMLRATRTEDGKAARLIRNDATHDTYRVVRPASDPCSVTGRKVWITQDQGFPDYFGPTGVTNELVAVLNITACDLLQFGGIEYFIWQIGNGNMTLWQGDNPVITNGRFHVGGLEGLTSERTPLVRRTGMLRSDQDGIMSLAKEGQVQTVERGETIQLTVVVDIARLEPGQGHTDTIYAAQLTGTRFWSNGQPLQPSEIGMEGQIIRYLNVVAP